MICRDFMIRICRKNPCRMHHKVKNCTIPSCNRNKLCKFVHLTEYEIFEINENVRPFRQTIYNELKRLAFVLRETFPLELRKHTCTLYMLGECLWPCLMCETAVNESLARCNKCYILLMQDIAALMCGHVYCNYCIDRLPFDINGALPLNYCIKCNTWSTFFKLFYATN